MSEGALSRHTRPDNSPSFAAAYAELRRTIAGAGLLDRAYRYYAARSALSFAFGYTAANDVSARDLQFSDGQWIRAKSIDTFCPIGPVLVTADGYDPGAKRIASRVNGTAMQESSTTEMVFSTAEILKCMSDGDWQRPGAHSEHKGNYTPERWLEIYGPHAHRHAEQILAARGAAKKQT